MSEHNTGQGDRCPACGQERKPEDRFCPRCGYRLEPLRAEDRGQAVPPVVSPPRVYPSHPAAPPLAARRNDGYCIAALVLGILSLLFGILAAVPAIVLGILGMNRVDRSRGTLGGKGMAVAGVVMGGLGILITFAVFFSIPVLVSAQRQAEKKTCLANMRNFLSAADIYAAYYEGYPTSSSTGTTPYRWPQDFYDGELKNGAPVCPGGGVITVYYGDSMTRPSIRCSKHGSP